MKRRVNLKTMIFGGLALAYLAVLATLGSPLLWLATTFGLVE